MGKDGKNIKGQGKVAHSDGDGQPGSAMQAAFDQAGVKSEDYKTTGAGVAAVARRLAERAKPKLLSQAELDEGRRRKREELLARQKEESEAVDALRADEITLEVYLIALQDIDLLSARYQRSIVEEVTLTEANSLAENFRTWPLAAQRVILQGKPDAESEVLRQGFNAWKHAQEKAREVARQEKRDGDRIEAQYLRKFATGTFHQVMEAGVGVVAVEGRYIVREPIKSSDGRKTWTPRKHPDGSVMTRWGFMLLEVSTQGNVRMGQVTKAVNFNLSPLPHPDKPTPLYPEDNFPRKDTNYGFFYDTPRELMVYAWREENERAERANLRETTGATLESLLMGGTGRANGYVKYLKTKDGKRDGSISFWIRGDGTRLYLTDHVCGRPSQDRQAWDFSDFPEAGIALHKEEGEYRAAELVRYILREMVSEETHNAEVELAKAKYEEFRAEEPDTVGDMGALLDLTSKGAYSRYFAWGRGFGRDRVVGMVAMRVESVGRGKSNRQVKLVRYFTTNPAFEIAIGTEVPASLKLPENPTKAQTDLVSMLRYTSGRKVEKSADSGKGEAKNAEPATPGESGESTGEVMEEVPVGTS